MPLRGKKTKNPPIFSHEFIIQNHADIVAVAIMVFLVGIMVEAAQPLASSFVGMQHNTTIDDGEESVTFYQSGVKDLCGVFFYTLVMVLVHAVIQEFGLDKLNKKLHLSKVKFNKYNESGQLFVFHAFSFLFAINLLADFFNPPDYLGFISSLWTDYPQSHSLMPFGFKLFYILQLSYWVHCFPELYLLKVKREDMQDKVVVALLYLMCIGVGYCLSYGRLMLVLLALHYLAEGLFHVSRLLYFHEKTNIAAGGFKLWGITFIIARVLSVMLSVLTFWFGLGKAHELSPSIGSSFMSRVTALSLVCLLQTWMMWNFINFYMRRSKEQEEAAKAAKKLSKTEKKKN